ncbi:MAG TPA: hypothetical protein VEU11_04930 [Terriglobales bacterium]|nr:hypothetical protein [Terriglobales bacterium]
MAHAASHAKDAEILKDHPALRMARGGYTYVIRREAERVTYSVSDGRRTVSAPILWAFGFGNMGQTYVYEYRGLLYESQVSFYSALHGLDITIGHRNSEPKQVEEAAGRQLQKLEVVRCFGCHTTGSLDAPAPGVRCDRCHKNAQQHARAFTDKSVPPVTPERLSQLSLEEQSDFCGACHRTWQEVSANGPHDINNLRFQPYRLATSNCYNSSAGDKRISCVACHDPHQNVVKSAEFYDAKCQDCHQPGNTSPLAKRCSVAQHGCVGCHMPKVDFPGGHFQFTDHRIRVLRPGSGYPG